MKDTQLITLSGFGELVDDETGDESDRKELAECAERHGVEFYPTYYDHELKGKREDIESITMELWSMSKDEWSENALTETELTETTNG
jgi:hypothetical protein